MCYYVFREVVIYMFINEIELLYLLFKCCPTDETITTDNIKKYIFDFEEIAKKLSILSKRGLIDSSSDGWVISSQGIEEALDFDRELNCEWRN